MHIKKIGSLLLVTALLFTSVTPIHAEEYDSLLGGNNWSTLTSEQRLDTSEDMYGQYFQYTGTSQSYTIPQSGYYNIYCKGGPRGVYMATDGTVDSSVYSPVICGVFYLPKGTELKIDVGGTGYTGSKGVLANGGYNGGGSSNQNQTTPTKAASTTRVASGGGGATAVYAKIPNETEYNSLVIAGGAGGMQVGRESKEDVKIAYESVPYGTDLTAASSARAGGGGGYPGGAGSYSVSTTYKWNKDPALSTGCINLAAYANVCNSSNICSACGCTSTSCNCPYTSPSLTTSYTTTKTTWYDGTDGGCAIYDVLHSNGDVSIMPILPENSSSSTINHNGGYRIYYAQGLTCTEAILNPYPFGRPSETYRDGLAYIGLCSVYNLEFNGEKPEYLIYNGNRLKYYYYNNKLIFKSSLYSVSDRWIGGDISGY